MSPHHPQTIAGAVEQQAAAARREAAELAAEASPCPMCGSYTGETLSRAPALLAVCDVLVVRALEAVGKRIVRQKSSRSRYTELGGRPWHFAHTLWAPDEHTLDKTLEGAWDVIPAMLDNHGCCGVTYPQVVDMLDSYVRDLLITSTPHTLPELRYRFQTRLGIEVALPTAYTGTGR